MAGGGENAPLSVAEEQVRWSWSTDAVEDEDPEANAYGTTTVISGVEYIVPDVADVERPPHPYVPAPPRPLPPNSPLPPRVVRPGHPWVPPPPGP